MREKLITFETAILAKEKGFNWLCNGFYGTNEFLEIWATPINNKKLHSMGSSAPVQSILQKWLREEHKINICIPSYSDGTFSFDIYWDKFKDYELTDDYDFFDTYEQALEVAIYESLKLI
jgi:histidinol-phosphate/aromatic aminotransferase/cobyric acid decarboxylase-like protein